MSILERLEDMYYGFLDRLVELGIPMDKIIGPLEARGINTFYLVSGILVLLISAGIFQAFFAPKYVVYSFVDTEGKPLSNVRVIAEVDGERLEFLAEDGRVTLPEEARILKVELEGYKAVRLDEVDGGFAIVLKPEEKTVEVLIRDLSAGTPIKATLKVLVNGNEVFSQDGSSFNLCFSPTKEECIKAGKGDRITFKAMHKTLGNKVASYSFEKLPSSVVLRFEKPSSSLKGVEAEEIPVTIRLYTGEGELLNGIVTIGLVSSPGNGIKVVVNGGIKKIRLPPGKYKVFSAEIFWEGKLSAVEVKDGSIFEVKKNSNEWNISVEIPTIEYSFKVYVKDEEGNPLSGANVRLELDSVKLSKSTEDGVATFTLSLTGCGVLNITKEEYTPKKVEFCVAEGDKTVTLKKVVKSGDVKVAVRLFDGTPIRNAIVYLTKGEQYLGLEAKTNADGIAIIKSVPVGEYDVVVEYKGSVLYENVIEVGEKKEKEITVTFVPNKGTLNITVTRDNIPVEAKVSILYRGKVIWEGESSFLGPTAVEVPGNVEIIPIVEYEGKKYYFEAVTVPPNGAEDITLELEFKEGIELVEIKKDGSPVGSLKEGEEYWAVIRVGYEKEAQFFIGLENAKAISSFPSGEVSEDGVAFSLKDGPAVKTMYIKFRVKEDAFFVSLSVGDKRYLFPVGEELKCTEDGRICYSFGLFYKDETVDVIDIWDIERYKVDLALLLRKEGFAPAAGEFKLIAQGGKGSVELMSGRINKGNIISSASLIKKLRSIIEEGDEVAFLLKVKGEKDKRWDTLDVGSFGVVADLKTLSPVVDINPNIEGRFLPTGDTTVNIEVKGVEEGITPIVKVSGCANEEKEGRKVNFSLDLRGCSSLKISVEAPFYKGWERTYRKYNVKDAVEITTNTNQLNVCVPPKLSVEVIPDAGDIRVEMIKEMGEKDGCSIYRFVPVAEEGSIKTQSIDVTVRVKYGSTTLFETSKRVKISSPNISIKTDSIEAKEDKLKVVLSISPTYILDLPIMIEVPGAKLDNRIEIIPEEGKIELYMTDVDISKDLMIQLKTFNITLAEAPLEKEKLLKVCIERVEPDTEKAVKISALQGVYISDPKVVLTNICKGEPNIDDVLNSLREKVVFHISRNDKHYILKFGNVGINPNECVVKWEDKIMDKAFTVEVDKLIGLEIYCPTNNKQISLKVGDNTLAVTANPADGYFLDLSAFEKRGESLRIKGYKTFGNQVYDIVATAYDHIKNNATLSQSDYLFPAYDDVCNNGSQRFETDTGISVTCKDNKIEIAGDGKTAIITLPDKPRLCLDYTPNNAGNLVPDVTCTAIERWWGVLYDKIKDYSEKGRRYLFLAPVQEVSPGVAEPTMKLSWDGQEQVLTASDEYEVQTKAGTAIEIKCVGAKNIEILQNNQSITSTEGASSLSYSFSSAGTYTAKCSWDGKTISATINVVAAQEPSAQGGEITNIAERTQIEQSGTQQTLSKPKIRLSKRDGIYVGDKVSISCEYGAPVTNGTIEIRKIELLDLQTCKEAEGTYREDGVCELLLTSKSFNTPPNITFTPKEPGIYKIQCTIIDDKGNTLKAEREITVESPQGAI